MIQTGALNAHGAILVSPMGIQNVDKESAPRTLQGPCLQIRVNTIGKHMVEVRRLTARTLTWTVLPVDSAIPQDNRLVLRIIVLSSGIIATKTLICTTSPMGLNLIPTMRRIVGGMGGLHSIMINQAAGAYTIQ